jgi:hypothetical protein
MTMPRNIPPPSHLIPVPHRGTPAFFRLRDRRFGVDRAGQPLRGQADRP